MNKASKQLIALLESRSGWPQHLTADGVRALLAQGADPNARGNYDRTALRIAVTAPHLPSDSLIDLEVVRVLLEAGADVNAVDKFGLTPLQCAATSAEKPAFTAHTLEVMRMLRDAGGAVRPHTDQWGAALYVSLEPTMYKMLLDAGARIDARDERNAQTGLHNAAATGREGDNVALLLSRGADPNALDDEGRTPLGIALAAREKPWVAHNQRTAEFDRVIQLLEAHGGRAHVAIAADANDPWALMPLDMAALRKATAPRKWPSWVGKLLGRSVASTQELVGLLRDEGDVEDAIAFVEAIGAALPHERHRVERANDVVVESPFFFKGTLIVKGHLSIQVHFAIAGDLVVEGVIEDCGPDSAVWVTGDVRCHSLNTDGDFAVGGAIDARDIVYGHFNDNTLTARVIRSPVVVEDDHAVIADVEAKHHFDIDTYCNRRGERGAALATRLRALFVPEILEEEEGTLEREALSARLRAGLPILR